MRAFSFQVQGIALLVTVLFLAGAYCLEQNRLLVLPLELAAVICGVAGQFVRQPVTPRVVLSLFTVAAAALAFVSAFVR